jgi:hypothetical protein
MMRLHEGQSSGLAILVKRVFAPLQAMYESMVREGVASGELIKADGMQIQLAMLGANVMYFLSAPVFRLVMNFEPFSPEALATRRKALVEFMGQALFLDRKHGAELAARVLADTPMPKIKGDRFMFRGKNERTE